LAKMLTIFLAGSHKLTTKPFCVKCVVIVTVYAYTYFSWKYDVKSLEPIQVFGSDRRKSLRS
jgi:hypothetical protein